MEHESTALVALILGVLVALAIAWVVSRQRARQRSLALREHFGPEYDRLVEQRGGAASAERELRDRQKRLEQLDIKLLSAEQSAKFGAEWAQVQQRFVDDPSRAARDAHDLVKEVMKARGYPVGDYQQRVADLSVEHGSVLDHYRAARALAQANESGKASTEDLRQAMMHYRALFNDLLRSQGQYARLSEAHA